MKVQNVIGYTKVWFIGDNNIGIPLFLFSINPVWPIQLDIAGGKSQTELARVQRARRTRTHGARGARSGHCARAGWCQGVPLYHLLSLRFPRGNLSSLQGCETQPGQTADAGWLGPRHTASWQTTQLVTKIIQQRTEMRVRFVSWT